MSSMEFGDMIAEEKNEIERKFVFSIKAENLAGGNNGWLFCSRAKNVNDNCPMTKQLSKSKIRRKE